MKCDCDDWTSQPRTLLAEKHKWVHCPWCGKELRATAAEALVTPVEINGHWWCSECERMVTDIGAHQYHAAKVEWREGVSHTPVGISPEFQYTADTKPAEPSHEVIMSEWWKVEPLGCATRWARVEKHFPGHTDTPYYIELTGHPAAWFTDREHAKVPPE